MSFQLKSVVVERWPVAATFVISRGAKTHVDVVVVDVAGDGVVGRGEGTPIYYRGETAAGCRDQIAALGDGPLDRLDIQTRLPPGAARNALDCALWDAEARRAGQPLWLYAGLAEPQALVTAFTISLGRPEAMARAATTAAARGFRLLKLKLTGEGDAARVAAVRAGAPGVRLIVDANEAWTGRDVAAEAAALVPFVVELIEQPVAAGRDALLDAVCSPIALGADESCHDRGDLAALVGRYAAVNIKLDKAGGLTEALALADATRAAGLGVMVGCMLSTSLGIAPAFLVAQQARWVDLDGPALLTRDRDGGFGFAGGRIAGAS